jgi:hypothetical protein
MIRKDILEINLTIQHALCCEKKVVRSKRPWMDSEAATSTDLTARPGALHMQYEMQPSSLLGRLEPRL